MSPFWGSFFEDLKERGRSGTVFLYALAGLVGLLVAAGIGEGVLHSVHANGLEGFLIMVLVGTGALCGLRIGSLFARRLKRKRERSEYLRLSSDELSKARSKLVKNQNRRSL